MEDVEADLNMLWRLKSLLVLVWEDVVEVVSVAGAEEEAPKMRSSGFRRLASVRVMATGGGAS
jgi:hypothetical protein